MSTRWMTWGLALALLLPGLGRAQILGQGDDGGAEMAPAASEASQVGAGVSVLGLADFDPVEDVPRMRNWVGAVDADGAGNCYGISLLTHYFYQKVDFVEGEGRPAEEWTEDLRLAGFRLDYSAALEHPLQLDERALELLPGLLARSLADVAANGKLKLAGATSLRDFTAPDSPWEARFRQWAEAIQFNQQIRANVGKYAGTALKNAVGFLPGDWNGVEGVIRDNVNIVRDRLREGRPVMISIHEGNNLAGHLLLAHQMRETQDRVEIVTYDCNSPPQDGAPRPTILTVFKDEDYRVEARRASDGELRYESFDLWTIPNPDEATDRRSFRKTAANFGEHLERNSHLGRIVDEDSSLWDKAKGVGGWAVEFVNPF